MATYASVSGKRQGAVTPARIVAAAVALTERHGLADWTLRQLAGEIRAYPAVIYHHVGDREAVVAAVLDQVVAQLPVPPDLPWREWFERLLTDARPVLRRYPGAARRLAVRGERVPALHEVAERGHDVLRAAGFADAEVVYTLLVTHAWQSIATEDDRAGLDREETNSDTATPSVDVYTYGLTCLLDGLAAHEQGIELTPGQGVGD
ncbi:AcrR family transcriptional regulator [Actinokineospora baliensis]|uniref:TetR/AcrR family transcriptional regulator n=1 Tax=Actinokineospora baliensis TaxID=547056 RepID=UPI00195A9948|nr:TetR/AcrR family transcriptional regulator C-terminal domain-containing protein [Actinokineospora baliensis]MBM7769859.1 AcrR family transcriptional regulator [Actinokineospora baliensis]